MGDYTKLIVHEEVNAPKKELKDKIKELGLYESAYHCDGVVESVEDSAYYKGYQENHINLTLVGQTKYGRGQNEFLDWLEPYIRQGSGVKGIWAFQIDEYGTEPNYRFLHPMDKGEY